MQEIGVGLCDAMIIPAWLYPLIDVDFFINDCSGSMAIGDRVSAAFRGVMSIAELIRATLAEESSMLRASSASGITGVQVDPSVLQAEKETAKLRLLEEGEGEGEVPALPHATATKNLDKAIPISSHSSL